MEILRVYGEKNGTEKVIFANLDARCKEKEAEKMADFKKEIYPDEIAQTLCNIASENPDEQTVKDCEEAIYQLAAIAENPYNSDYYRTLYRVLEEIAKKQ